MLCPDLVPAEPGKMIPACTYNLIYRMQDERFYQERDEGRRPRSGIPGLLQQEECH
jgi:hypothetical protein